MGAIIPNPKTTRAFASEAAFEAWLRKKHDQTSEVWIKMFKKASGKPSIDWNQAVDVALCWGWIDGVRMPFDELAFLQRFTPRKAKSRWSEINVQRVERLSKAGRMTAHGQRHVDAAKTDGRWADAYPGSSKLSLPQDLLDAIQSKPKALATFLTLNRQNQYALAYRMHHTKPERRPARIAAFVSMLAQGDTIHPNSAAKAPRPAAKKKPKPSAKAKRSPRERASG